MRNIVSDSPAATRRIAGKLLKLARKNRTRPIVFALSGELGSGKTTFIQGLARALGLRENVQSPTFVLAKWYRIPKRFHRFHRFHHFIHVDAYRIEKRSEARHLGLPAMLNDRDAVVAIEWAERIERLIPRMAIWISFQHTSKSERVITLP